MNGLTLILNKLSPLSCVHVKFESSASALLNNYSFSFRVNSCGSRCSCRIGSLLIYCALHEVSLKFWCDAIKNLLGQLVSCDIVPPVPVREAFLIVDRRRPLIGNLLSKIRLEIECHTWDKPLNVPAEVSSAEGNSCKVVYMSVQALAIGLEILDSCIDAVINVDHRKGSLLS